MGVKSGLFGCYYTCPFQENQVSEVYSGKKRAKWKIQNEPFWFSGGFAFWAQVFLIFQVLFCVVGVVSGGSWDGVIVTEADFQALQAFKHELVDPKGFLRSWNDSGYGACSGGWVGIKCAQGQVIVIQLPWRGLGGRITEKIGQFQALRKLSLHDNFIVGSIPTSLGFLPNLRGVQLFNNRLSGSIPASLGLCPLLQTLDLANNSLSGPIPPTLVNSTKLFRLNISYNQLSGSIPYSFTQSSSLMFLALENNNLSGPIPDSWGKLSVLNLRNNRLDGRIPASIGNVSSLSELDLSYNNFTGEIPSSLGDLPNLVAFNVSYNNLSGPVPTELAQKGSSHSLADHCCILLLFDKETESGKRSQGWPAASKAAAEKGVPPTASEVEASGETGGKLVHFDGPLVFSADDLLCATAEIMGKSTYGTVYKATMEDGIQVAVKRLREKITKGQREFEIEVNALGKIRHPNLLALRAYYLGPKGEKLLVFDYMPKGSLATFLHARAPDTPIDWPTRMKIAKGMTRGLLYLHNNVNIIHGNLTSSNVLLDEHTNAKIADYGLSRLMTAAANANVIATAGALGYRAPELSKLKKATTKTDIYSLGVIILELLTGKSPGEALNGVDLPQWVAQS
ncbi:UNVERIFIED_CONTAM: putative leucine-rich repeat receptor-like protein kinase IMK3 [Sesamum radiatum]|uniref:non-specific serine/threonine protein kinase n=1 Tax=Sesamum radiatum TaxID=300843 RepID=A0AAW2NFI7_SESRA